MSKKMQMIGLLIGCSITAAALAGIRPKEILLSSDRASVGSDRSSVQLSGRQFAAQMQGSPPPACPDANAAELLTAIQTKVREEAGGYGPGVHIVPDEKVKMPVMLAPGQTKSSVITDSLKGIRSVPDGAVFDFKDIAQNGKSGFRPASEIASDANLYIERRDVSRSGLTNSMLRYYTYSGTFLQGPKGIENPELRKHFETPTGRTGWTGLVRVFDNHPVLGAVLFQESDIAAANGTVLIPQSAINSRVFEYPATLSRKRDTAGRAMSEISWVEEGRRIYSISAGAVDDRSVSALSELAESLARH